MKRRLCCQFCDEEQLQIQPDEQQQLEIGLFQEQNNNINGNSLNKQMNTQLVFNIKNQYISPKQINNILEQIHHKNHILKRISINCQNCTYYKTFPSRLFFSSSQASTLQELEINFSQTPANSLNAVKKIKQISSTLKKLYLNLQDTPISLIDYHTICETLSKLQSLEDLELIISRNLKSKNISALSEALKEKRQLQNLRLDFQDNMSQQEEMNQFFQTLKELTNLKQLRLNIDNSQNCILNDECGLSLRYLLKQINDKLNILEFSANQTESTCEFWINFFSGLRNNSSLKVFSLIAHSLFLIKSSTFLRVLIQTFPHLKDLECINIKSDYLNHFLQSFSQVKFNQLKHIQFDYIQNQRNVIIVQPHQPIIINQEQINNQFQLRNNSQNLIQQTWQESESNILFSEFLVQNFCTLKKIKFLKNPHSDQNILLNKMRKECMKFNLEITSFNKKILSNLSFHHTLIIWDLYF